jgi:hypothetical protein
MSLPRFSLRAFLIATVYIALVITAVIRCTDEWADAVFSASLGILLVATLAGFFLSDSSRTFWLGFCLTAWIYMFLAFAPMEARLRDRLTTDRILIAAQRFVATIQTSSRVTPGFKRRELTQRIGHSAWAILLGVTGGYLAVNFNKRNSTRPSAG